MTDLEKTADSIDKTDLEGKPEREALVGERATTCPVYEFIGGLPRYGCVNPTGPERDKTLAEVAMA